MPGDNTFIRSLSTDKGKSGFTYKPLGQNKVIRFLWTQNESGIHLPPAFYEVHMDVEGVLHVRTDGDLPMKIIPQSSNLVFIDRGE